MSLYFHEKFSKQCNYKTRLITESGIRPDRILHSDLAFKNFTNRSIQQWNDLPANIKNSSNLPQFKTSLKEWIKSNIDH